MSVQVQMIGTGSAFAKRYFNNNALITVNGFKLLIDCGITAPYALHQLDVELTDIDGILVTHIHGDHIGGLEEIAFRMKYVHQSKPRLLVPAAIQDPLWETSLRGSLEDASTNSHSLSCYFDIFSMLPGTSYELRDGFTVELIPTRHIPGKPSFAVLINNCVFYSSDCVFDPDLLGSLIKEGRCRHILHDCQLEGPGNVHASLDELLTLPESLQEHIWLMHYSDNRDLYIGKTGKMKFIEQQQIYRFT